jgi:hypothetical protein
MSKCCCCLSVTTGATILGLIGILMAAAELVPLVPYLIESESFNPIRENVEKMFYVMEQMLEENKFTKDEIDEIVLNIRAYLWPFILGETISSGLYALLAFFLVIGVQMRKRVLMLPYMIVQVFSTLWLIIVLYLTNS